jgi:hypothetical protein
MPRIKAEFSTSTVFNTCAVNVGLVMAPKVFNFQAIHRRRWCKRFCEAFSIVPKRHREPQIDFATRDSARSLIFAVRPHQRFEHHASNLDALCRILRHRPRRASCILASHLSTGLLHRKLLHFDLEVRKRHRHRQRSRCRCGREAAMQRSDTRPRTTWSRE